MENIKGLFKENSKKLQDCLKFFQEQFSNEEMLSASLITLIQKKNIALQELDKVNANLRATQQKIKDELALLEKRKEAVEKDLRELRDKINQDRNKLSEDESANLRNKTYLEEKIKQVNKKEQELSEEINIYKRKTESLKNALSA